MASILSTESRDKRPLLLIMDGHALIYRAWHAIKQPLSISSTGEEVRAVYGFLNSFIRTVSEWRPTHCAIAFDLPTPTFRHIEFKEYKAHRPPTPPELISQFDRIRQLVTAFNIPIYEMAGYEADDIIGTLSLQAESRELETLIVTGDTDTLQLVSPLVKVHMVASTKNQKVYDESAVMDRYGGLPPKALPDVKGLQGDSSDNIPGVPGIGNKTAIKLISQYGDIESLYGLLESVPQTKLRQSLEENHGKALQAKRLTTIVRDVPVKLDLDACQFWKYNRDTVIEFLKEMEFYSFVSRIPNTHQDEDAKGSVFTQKGVIERDNILDVRYLTVQSNEDLNSLVAELESSTSFTFDVETTSKNPMLADLVGIAFSTEPGKAWYVPMGHKDGKQIPIDTILKKLSPLFLDRAIGKSAHNANYDITVLARHGMTVRNLESDTMLAAHMMGKQSIGLKALALEYFGKEMTPITDLIGTGRKQITMDQVPINKAAPYACADADFTKRLNAILRKEIGETNTSDLYKNLEVPLVQILVRMQLNGVLLNQELLSQMSSELAERLSAVETDVYDILGHEFNLNSSQQLSGVLFNELRLPPSKKTKTGYSTDASSLESLKHILNTKDSETVDPRAIGILDQILEYRQLAKVKSTYVDSLPTLVNPHTKRIHTRYNQTGSSTGRLSSNDPNVQNIPVRTDLGRRVRQAFIAKNAPENILLAVDYSQIELRVLAHISQDAGLLDAFHKGEDIHSSTASAIYGIQVDSVTSDMRRIAKIMNFGVLYGLSAYGISRQTNLGPREGTEFINTYFGKYPRIQNYIESVKTKAYESGYVETLMGRRRYIPELTSSNRIIKASGERMAVNMPIQGTAADIIKIAMIRIQERIDALSLRTMMIIQVHDELIFEVPNTELDEMKSIVNELMPSAMTLDVPLTVEMKTGYNWCEMT